MATLPVAEAREDVAVLFLSYLGRAPEFQAMNYYVGLYNQLLAAEGTSAAAEENAFKALSAQIYVDAGNVGEIPSGPSVSDGEYVDWIYQNVLGRAADEGGRAYWIAQLGNGAIDRADLVGIVVAAAAEDDRDGAYLANRTTVALEFAKFENSNPQIIDSLQFNAKQVLEGVNETEASVAAAEAKLVSATNGGQSFTLTVGVDNLTGTSGNDVFNAVPVNPTNSADANTLGAFDTIDGGAGRDTLNIYTGYNSATDTAYNVVQQGTVRNVEVINIYNSEDAVFADDAGVDASKFVGAEEIWQHGEATTVNKVAAGVTVGFADLVDHGTLRVNLTDANQTASVVFQDIVKTSDSDQRLNVTGKTVTDVVVKGNIIDQSGEDDSDITLDLYVYTTDAKAKDVTLKVASELDTVIELRDNRKAIVAIDASASTGNIEYNVDEEDGVKSFIGGAGDDVVIFERDIAIDDKVDGGAGANTVILEEFGATLVTQDYDILNSFKNIQTLGFYDGDVSFDAAKLAGFDSFTFFLDHDQTASIDNLSADQALTVSTWSWFDTATLALNNAAADVSLTLEGEDTELLLTVTGDNKVSGGTLTVAGEGELEYSNAGGKFATIDVSEFEGSFALTGLAGNVAESIVLGEGSTTITLSVGIASSTYLNMDVITGFDATTSDTDDVRDYLEGVNIQGTVSTTGMTDVRAIFEKAAAQYSTEALDGDDVLLFQFDGNTYLYASNGDVAGRYDNSDFAIKLIGLYTESQLDSIPNPP